MSLQRGVKRSEQRCSGRSMATRAAAGRRRQAAVRVAVVQSEGSRGHGRQHRSLYCSTLGLRSGPSRKCNEPFSGKGLENAPTRGAKSWRPRPESNRGARICSPLGHHSPHGHPHRTLVAELKRPLCCTCSKSRFLGGIMGAGPRTSPERPLNLASAYNRPSAF